MTITLSFNVSHDLGSFAARLSAYPERVERALFEATREATRHTERFFGEEMIRRAGGVYWDIDAVASAIPGGARGLVSTHKSRAHRIEPTKPHGLLGPMVLDGRRMFVQGGVNHPGSRPMDVLTPLRTTEIPVLRGIYRDHVRGVLSSRSPSAMPVGAL